MTILGAPVIKDNAQNSAEQNEIDDLNRATKCFKFLHAHDALVILKNSLATPKLLYLLRTSECADNPLLRKFNDTLAAALTTVLNVSLSDDQWLQASLPVGDGGLGIQSTQMLAPSAFLASAESTLQLQQSIFPDSISALSDQSAEATEALWIGLANSPTPAVEVQHIQKAWDKQFATNHQALIFSRAPCE